MINTFQRVVDPIEIIRQHPFVARPFLAKGEGRRVLHVGATDLNNVIPFGRLGGNGVAECPNRRDQAQRHVDRGCDIHRRRKGVIRRLRHVDVIIWMNWRLAAERRSGKLAATVRDDLVNIHIELGTAARHPHVQRKHRVVLAG